MVWKWYEIQVLVSVNKVLLQYRVVAARETVCGTFITLPYCITHYKRQWCSYNSAVFQVPCILPDCDILPVYLFFITSAYLLCQNKKGRLWMLLFQGTVKCELFCYFSRWPSILFSCNNMIAVLKEPSICQHYQTKYLSQYFQLLEMQRKGKSDNLKWNIHHRRICSQK